MTRTTVLYRPFPVIAIMLLLAYGGCESEARVGGDSETHFLQRCDENCGGGLSCICGICTKRCAENVECSSLSATAQCLSSEGNSCAEAEPLCEVPCSDDADCNTLSGAHFCEPSRGMCRAGDELGSGTGGSGSGASTSTSTGSGAAAATPSSSVGTTTGAGGSAAGASTSGEAGSGGTSVGGGATDQSTSGEGGGAGDACAGFEPVASAAEVAEAGRDDADAEILALRAAREVVAPTALYERISSDLQAIRTLEPGLAGVHAWDVFYDWFSVELDEESFAAFEREEYHAWDCANAHYGLSALSTVGVRSVALSFEPKRYLIPLISEQYRTLPGIVTAGVGASGDAPDICLEINGDAHRYLFDDASGGCGVACTEHAYSAFDVSIAGDVTPLGTFCESQSGACEENQEEPEWLAPLLVACTPFPAP